MQISLSTTFQAMASPARRSILRRLAGGPASVGELARPLDMTAPAVSHHLKVLERAGLVARQIDGQARVISLQPEGLVEMEDWLHDLHRVWHGRFDRLDQQVMAGEAHDLEAKQNGGRT